MGDPLDAPTKPTGASAMSLLPRAIRTLLARKAPDVQAPQSWYDHDVPSPRHCYEIADLDRDTYLEKLARMRRDMNGE